MIIVIMAVLVFIALIVVGLLITRVMIDALFKGDYLGAILLMIAVGFLFISASVILILLTEHLYTHIPIY